MSDVSLPQNAQLFTETGSSLVGPSSRLVSDRSSLVNDVNVSGVDANLRQISAIESRWRNPELPFEVKMDLAMIPGMQPETLSSFLNGLDDDLNQPDEPPAVTRLRTDYEQATFRQRTPLQDVQVFVLGTANTLAPERPDADSVKRFKQRAIIEGYLPASSASEVDNRWSPELQRTWTQMAYDDLARSYSGDRAGAVSTGGLMRTIHDWTSPSGLLAATTSLGLFPDTNQISREFSTWGEKWGRVTQSKSVADFSRNLIDAVTGPLDDIVIPVINWGLIIAGAAFTGGTGSAAVIGANAARAATTAGRFTRLMQTANRVMAAQPLDEIMKPGFISQRLMKSADGTLRSRIGNSMWAWRQKPAVARTKQAVGVGMRYGLVGQAQQYMRRPADPENPDGAGLFGFNYDAYSLDDLPAIAAASQRLSDLGFEGVAPNSDSFGLQLLGAGATVFGELLFAPLNIFRPGTFLRSGAANQAEAVALFNRVGSSIARGRFGLGTVPGRAAIGGLAGGATGFVLGEDNDSTLTGALLGAASLGLLPLTPVARFTQRPLGGAVVAGGLAGTGVAIWETATNDNDAIFDPSAMFAGVATAAGVAGASLLSTTSPFAWLPNPGKFVGHAVNGLNRINYEQLAENQNLTVSLFRGLRQRVEASGDLELLQRVDDAFRGRGLTDPGSALRAIGLAAGVAEDQVPRYMFWVSVQSAINYLSRALVAPQTQEFYNVTNFIRSSIRRIDIDDPIEIRRMLINNASSAGATAKQRKQLLDEYTQYYDNLTDEELFEQVERINDNADRFLDLLHKLSSADAAEGVDLVRRVDEAMRSRTGPGFTGRELGGPTSPMDVDITDSVINLSSSPASYFEEFIASDDFNLLANWDSFLESTASLLRFEQDALLDAVPLRSWTDVEGRIHQPNRSGTGLSPGEQTDLQRAFKEMLEGYDRFDRTPRSQSSVSAGVRTPAMKPVPLLDDEPLEMLARGVASGDEDIIDVVRTWVENTSEYSSTPKRFNRNDLIRIKRERIASLEQELEEVDNYIMVNYEDFGGSGEFLIPGFDLLTGRRAPTPAEKAQGISAQTIGRQIGGEWDMLLHYLGYGPKSQRRPRPKGAPKKRRRGPLGKESLLQRYRRSQFPIVDPVSEFGFSGRVYRPGYAPGTRNSGERLEDMMEGGMNAGLMERYESGGFNDWLDDYLKWVERRVQLRWRLREARQTKIKNMDADKELADYAESLVPQGEIDDPERFISWTGFRFGDGLTFTDPITGSNVVYKIPDRFLDHKDLRKIVDRAATIRAERAGLTNRLVPQRAADDRGIELAARGDEAFAEDFVDIDTLAEGELGLADANLYPTQQMMDDVIGANLLPSPDDVPPPLVGDDALRMTARSEPDPDVVPDPDEIADFNISDVNSELVASVLSMVQAGRLDPSRLDQIVMRAPIDGRVTVARANTLVKNDYEVEIDRLTDLFNAHRAFRDQEVRAALEAIDSGEAYQALETPQAWMQRTPKFFEMSDEEVRQLVLSRISAPTSTDPTRTKLVYNKSLAKKLVKMHSFVQRHSVSSVGDIERHVIAAMRDTLADRDKWLRFNLPIAALAEDNRSVLNPIAGVQRRIAQLQERKNFVASEVDVRSMLDYRRRVDAAAYEDFEAEIRRIYDNGYKLVFGVDYLMPNEIFGRLPDAVNDVTTRHMNHASLGNFFGRRQPSTARLAEERMSRLKLSAKLHEFGELSPRSVDGIWDPNDDTITGMLADIQRLLQNEKDRIAINQDGYHLRRRGTRSVTAAWESARAPIIPADLRWNKALVMDQLQSWGWSSNEARAMYAAIGEMREAEFKSMGLAAVESRLRRRNEAVQFLKFLRGDTSGNLLGRESVGLGVGAAIGYEQSEGEGGLERLRSAAVGGAIGLGASQLPRLVPENQFARAITGAYGRSRFALFDQYARYRDLLRFGISPLFDLSRYTEGFMLGQTAAPTGADARRISMPLDMSPTGVRRRMRKAMQNATPEEVRLRFEDYRNDFRSMALADFNPDAPESSMRWMQQVGIMGFNLTDWQTGAFIELSQMGMESRAAYEAAKNMFTYGVTGRSAAELSVNFVFFPFSFQKKAFGSLANFLQDDLSRSIFLTDSFLLYQALNEQYDLDEYWREYVPFMQQLSRLNLFAYGLSPGRLGGINSQLFETIGRGGLQVGEDVFGGDPERSATSILGDIAGAGQSIAMFTPWVGSIRSEEDSLEIQRLLRSLTPVINDINWMAKNLQDTGRIVFEGGRAFEQVSRGYDEWNAYRRDLEQVLRDGGYTWWHLHRVPALQALSVDYYRKRAELYEKYPQWGQSRQESIFNAQMLDVERQHHRSRYLAGSNDSQDVLFTEYQMEVERVAEALAQQGVDVGGNDGWLDAPIEAVDYLKGLAADTLEKDPRFMSVWEKFYMREFGPIATRI